MELWGWLIGYLVLFALLHLILYYVYVRRDGDGDGTGTPSFADPNRASSPSSPGPDGYPRAREVDEYDAPDEDRDLEGEETVRCPHCGAHNASDQAYTYCWHCVSTLRR